MLENKEQMKENRAAKFKKVLNAKIMLIHYLEPLHHFKFLL